MSEASFSTEELQVKHKACTDLYYFAKNILGYQDMVSHVHKEVCDMLSAPEDVLILMPRGHFKTSCTISFVIWAICKNPDVRILYSHKVLAKSKDILREVKGHFEKNKQLNHFFGKMQGDPWGQYQLTVRTTSRPNKEPSVEVGGLGHEITGGHYDYIIHDDLAGLADMTSEAERQNTERYYKSSQFLRDGDKTREIVLGTRWADEDVYNYILEKKPPVKKLIKRARNKNGKPLFPERYTDLYLTKLQNDDPVSYSAQMNNEPLSEIAQLYKLSDLKLFPYSDVYESAYNIAYIDPAFGRGSKGKPCDFCLIVGSLVGDKISVVKWITNKDKPEDNEMLIVDIVKQFHIKKLCIESNAAQSEFARNVRRTLQESKIVLGVDEINHNVNKDRRIQGMHGTVKEKVYFREDWKAEYEEAMRQLTRYPSSKMRDAPDALSGLIEMSNRPKSGKFNDDEKPSPGIMAGIMNEDVW